MTDDLNSIKSDPAVLRVYGQYTSLKKNADKWVGLCPLHSEKTGSFTVFQDMRWTCFGGCGSGNIFQLVQQMDGCSFEVALEKIKAEIGGNWAEAKAKVEATFRPVAEPKTYKTIPLASWAKMEAALQNSPEAVAWLLNERGITLETAKKLRLGFAQNIETLAGNDGADIAASGWIAFPSIEGDKVVSVKYRSLVRKKPGGFARQPGMATAMFNTETVDLFSPVFLVEGEFDCAALEQVGFHSVSVPSGGTKLTPDHKDQLMKAAFVVLAGDTDVTGSSYMQKLWRELAERTYLLSWPDGMKDANQTFLEKCKGDLSIFRTLVEELTQKAKTQPLPDVYNLQEVLRNGDGNLLAEHPDRLRFPWPTVDKMVNILPGDILGVGSSNTGMGKSTWTHQVCLHNARKQNTVVINYQAEMQPSELDTMTDALLLHKDRNFLSAEDKSEAANLLDGVQYYVGNNPTLSDINAVLDVIEAAIRRLGAGIVCLDHFHHLTTGSDNETKVQSTAMTRIKQIAQTYQVKFINVGQPRKANQQTKGKKIHITDFKGSGAWGDAANAVIAIHRDLNKTEDPALAKGVYEDKTLVQVLKARSMGTGPSACYLTSFGEFAAFEEIESNYGEGPE